jgi:23S rRNA (adenine2503-C2)-methyltransferase
MNLLRLKKFANGRVYALQTQDGYPLETTDTFLPSYTKEATGRRQNTLSNTDLGSRHNRWMVGVSVMSGCPVGCKFCATGQLSRWRKLTADEIVDQVKFIVGSNPDYNPNEAYEFKINYTRMGEPFLNLEAVKEAIGRISELFPKAHHYVSTIGVKGSTFDWIHDRITLQLSLHSLDETRRHALIPYPTMSIEELGQVRTKSALKTTVNLTLVDKADFDIQALKKYFDPMYFFIKLSPINPNATSEKNGLGKGIVQQINLV